MAGYRTHINMKVHSAIESTECGIFSARTEKKKAKEAGLVEC